MPQDSATLPPTLQASPEVSLQLQQRLTDFVKPLLRTLDQQLDVRLVRTFLATLIAILQWRNRAHGLLLSELGAYLRSPKHAPAATKRLSNLLRSDRWTAEVIALFLWAAARERVRSLLAQQEQPLLFWDESVLEKPESLKSQGLCSVRSSKARRLKRIRPGHLCALLMRYPKARFVLMHNAYPYSDDLIAIAKHYPNAYIDMCWAWSIDPYSACDTLRRTIHAVPSNKVFVFGGDVWWPSASVAYAAQARAWLCRALEAEVNEGLLNEREAMAYATRLMRENQLDCFDVAGRRAALLAAAPRTG